MNPFKKFYIKFLLTIKKITSKNDDKSNLSAEQKAMSIFRRSLNNPDSTFTVAPFSGKYYIVNKSINVFIILEDSNLDITNHVYHYDIKLKYDNAIKLQKMFNTKLELDAIAYEKEVKSNIMISLDTILKNVSKNNLN